MESELEEKQSYLRINILEKGYDAEQFMGFLQSKKGESGLDLNSWSLDELISAVQEFTGEIKSQEEETQGMNDAQNENNDLNSAEPAFGETDGNQNTDEVKAYNIDDFIPESEKIKEDEYLPCQKCEQIEVYKNKSVYVHLGFPEKTEGGIFSKAYVSYLVETEPFGYKVRKRYSDFEWLRNILNTQYINCIIPPLCKKNYADRFTDYLISKRTRAIEKFMNGVLTHPLMRNSQVFHDFISLENNEFETRKKQYNKVTGPTTIKEVPTISGKIKVTVSREKEIYFENIKDNADINEDLLKKITAGYKDLMLAIQSVSEKMKDLSNLWKELHTKSVKYFESTNTSETYNIMSKLMSDWSEMHKKEVGLLNINIREYFRFIKNEFHGLKDLAVKVDNNKSIYSKAFEKLFYTKENLYKEQDLTVWGLEKEDMNNKLILLKDKALAFSKMLPKESRRVNEIKNFYGFYLNSIITEYERLRALNARRHKENITRFIKVLTDSLTDFHLSLADQSALFDDMKDEEDPGNVQKLDEESISGNDKNLANEGENGTVQEGTG